MKVSDFITQGERQIKDAVGTRRWGNTVWLMYLNDALRRLFGTHPEAFYLTDIVTEMPAELTVVDQQIPIMDGYITGLLHDCCSWIMSEDREAAGNAAVADAHYQKAILET
jgi:hypothetical protein